MSCGQTATAPTPPPPPPPPIASAPSITCPNAISITATGTTGARVSYPPPEHQGGEGAITVTCTPASDEVFAIGSTQVDCVIKDALNRSDTCHFAITVLAAPRLRLTRFMAFGDSLTTGQTVIPGTDDIELASNPATAYPTVLTQLLAARYTTQSFDVSNEGKPAEKSALALGRFIDAFRAHSPEAVIILEGVNDIIAAETIGAGIEAAEAGVSALAADARNRHVMVFLVNLPPTKPGRRRVPISAIQGFNDRLRVIARGEGAQLIDIFTPLSQDVGAMIDTDGLHLTPAGYRRVAETVFAALRESLEIK